jgi:hypothetical protein
MTVIRIHEFGGVPYLSLLDQVSHVFHPETLNMSPRGSLAEAGADQALRGFAGRYVQDGEACAACAACAGDKRALGRGS